MVFHNDEEIRADPGKRLAAAFDRPEYFGYELRVAPDFSGASPSAIGTLAYVAFETRRLFEEMKPRGQSYQPLPVTALVKPSDFASQQGREVFAHCSGQVFDIDYSGLPPAELECLRFVLDDMEWDGYLGFIEEGRDNLHIGCSPTAREFFTSVFQEAVGPAATR